MKILLVEDDDRISGALAEALTDQHYAVDVAIDGQQGWEFIETYQYSLILLDWMLPRLDGIRLCHRLRQQGVQTPVLLLTAKDTRITHLPLSENPHLCLRTDQGCAGTIKIEIGLFSNKEISRC